MTDPFAACVCPVDECRAAAEAHRPYTYPAAGHPPDELLVTVICSVDPSHRRLCPWDALEVTGI